MSTNWREVRPGFFVADLEDGRIVFERREPSESFRQGELRQTQIVGPDDNLLEIFETLLPDAPVEGDE